MTELRSAPGPKGHWLLGSLPDYSDDIIKLFLESVDQYGDIVRFRLANRYAYLVRSPAEIEHVLKSRHKYYNKNTHGIRRVKEFLGDGLVTSWGSIWKRQRRIVQQAFRKKTLLEMDVSFVDAAEFTKQAWTREIESGGEINITESMMRHTVRTASSTMFNTKMSEKADRVIGAFVSMNELVNERIPRIFNAPLWIPTAENRAFLHFNSTIHATIQELIAERRDNPVEANDLLGLLMEARDEETGEGFSDDELRYQLITLLVGGFDTSANVLSFTLYSLAANPHILHEVREEAKRVLGSEMPEARHIPALEYTGRVIAESLRLYPPVWLFGRNALEDDMIGGYEIPKGSLVMVPPFVAHRHPTHWPDPEVFSPDRHLPENRKDAPKFSYFPFGGGPRQCVGMGYANVQLPLTIAHLARSFELEVPDDYELRLRPAVTLGTDGPIRLNVKPV